MLFQTKHFARNISLVNTVKIGIFKKKNAKKI